MPQIRPTQICVSFAMKTIRLRNRAMIVFAIGCLGVLVLMKSLGDNSSPSDANGSLKSRNPDGARRESNNLKGVGAKPLLHPPAPQERREDDAFLNRKLPPIQPREGGIKWQMQPQAQINPGLPIQNMHQNPVYVNNINAGQAIADTGLNRPVDNFQVENSANNKHGQLPPLQANMKIQNLPLAAADGSKQSDRPGYPEMVNGKFVPPHRVVHFDLKGAAMRVSYFRDVFPLLKSLGATGVLLEWEDMFPYTGELAIARHRDAYSEADVRQILNYANQAGLDIMPLVQTFGHLEWFLKFERFAHLRQQERYPQVICLADDEAVNVVKMAIDQVMSIHRHFPMPFFHMGADEAFQVGMCQKDQQMMRRSLDNSREKLMIRHISLIGKYIKEKYNTRVQMWHDMLNNVDTQMMREFKLGELVEPVVWAYAENLNEYLMPDMWQRFGEVFPYIWGGSSFKGADGPSRYWSNVPHYLQNHISWTQQMTREFRNFKEFRGLILTGWQRFDHFAVLCEIWPVGIPSVAVNLQTVMSGQYDKSVLKRASDHLQCSSIMDIDSLGVAAYCKFPGAKVYQGVQQLKISLENIKTNIYEDYQIHGWLSPFNIKHNYSSAWYLDQIMDKVQMYASDLQSVARVLRDEMKPIFFPDMIDEWMFEYVEPDLDKLKGMIAAARKISEIKSFPVRPFKIHGSTSEWAGPPDKEGNKAPGAVGTEDQGFMERKPVGLRSAREVGEVQDLGGQRRDFR